jgi:hypothetical protein
VQVLDTARTAITAAIGLDSDAGVSTADQLGALAFAVMVLHVTGCSVLDCGPGVCVVQGGGPTCDCAGSDMVGPRCEAPLSPSTSPMSSASTSGSPHASASGSPTPSPSAVGSSSSAPLMTVPVTPLSSPTALPTPLPRALVCPGRWSGLLASECSGHGVCVHSFPGCTEDSADCVAACRWVRDMHVGVLWDCWGRVSRWQSVEDTERCAVRLTHMALSTPVCVLGLLKIVDCPRRTALRMGCLALWECRRCAPLPSPYHLLCDQMRPGFQWTGLQSVTAGVSGPHGHAGNDCEPP